MEGIGYMAAVFGLSENSFVTIVIAFIAFLGTAATVGYKYKSNKSKPEDNAKVIFDQVNAFIVQQKQDRDELRAELKAVKDELVVVRQENQEIRDENQVLREENQGLRDEIQELREGAAQLVQSNPKPNTTKEK